MSLAATIREPFIRALGLVGAVHFMSHFYGMVLPPLIPVLNADLGMSFTLLGVLMAVQSTSSGLLQFPAGTIVDRLGAKRMVLIGLVLCSLCIGLIGLVSSPILLCILVLGFGAGNSLFHPTNYSILNSSMPERYMGRAFSAHNFAGQFGTAVAPLVILTIAMHWGWRAAAISAGLVGLIISLLIVAQMDVLKDDSLGEERKKADAGAEAKPAAGAKPMSMQDVLAHVLKTPAILYLFMFYAVTSLASGGVKDFAVAGLVAAQGTSFQAAGSAVTGFFLASAVGVLAGGWVADQSTRHDLIASISFAVAALLVAIVGLIDMHYVLIVFCFTVAGFVDGMIRPSRDMMIRKASPKGGMGQIFGFVFSGTTIGGVVAPITYGIILDSGHPAWVFYVSSAFMVMCMLFILASGRAARRRAEADQRAGLAS